MSLTHQLRYKSANHDKLLEAVQSRVQYAESAQGGFYKRCQENEDLFYAYIDTPIDEATNPKQAKDDKRRPAYKTLRIPYSYAIALTDHTYIASTFLSRSPIFSVPRRHGETAMQELCIEAYIAYQVTAGGMMPQLFNWTMDPYRYGVGIVNCGWKKEFSTVSRLVKQESLLGFGPSRKVLVEETLVSYEGNRVYCVRPLDFIWDPRVSLINFQQGEFAGEFALLPVSLAKNLAAQGEFISENVEIALKLPKMEKRRSGSSNQDEPRRWDKLLFSEQDPYAKTNSQRFGIETLDVVMTLIPKEYGLSASTRPTKYLITVAEDEIILRAAPLGYYHNSFPWAVIPYEIDMYKSEARSLLKIVQPFEEAMTFLINQHFYNVRKHLRNTMIVDPSKIVLKDMYSETPGGIIRMRPESYGTDPQTAVFQVPATDITRAHLADLRMLEEFAQRLTGTNDNVMGLANPGGRKTAQEIRTSSSFATNRLKIQAEWFSATGFSALARQLLSNSQQFLSEELEIRLTGDLRYKSPQQQMETVQITPESIAGFYDYEPVDGTMPVDRTAIAYVMKDYMATMASLPGFAQQFDLVGFTNYIGQMLGAKNLQRFKIEVTPDDAIRNAAASGQAFPVTGAPQ